MSNFFELLKVNILETFKLNSIFKKNKEGKKLLKTFILLSLFAVFFFFIIVVQMYAYTTIFKEAGFPEMVLIMGDILGISLIFITNISQIGPYLYNNKDFDMLMSFPLSKKEVVASKVVSLMLINYASFFIVFVPSIIGYSLVMGITTKIIVSAIIGFFIMPLIPIVLSGVVSYLFGFIKISPKVKHMISLILSIVLFTVIILASFLINSFSALSENKDAIIMVIKKVYYPSYLLFDAMTNKLSSLIILSLISVAVFILFIILVSKNYIKINARRKASYTNKRFVLKETKKESTLKTLFIREVKRYFGSTSYCLQTILGPVMSVIFTLVIYFNYSEIGLEGLGIDLGVIMLFVIVFSLGIAPTTSVGISIEGKYFWILKTSPIKTKEIFLSKILLNFIISFIGVVINLIFAIFLFKLKIYYVLLIFVIGTLYIMFTSCFGLYINVYNYNFSWTNEAKLVKQSTPVMITTFGSMIFTFIIAASSITFISLFQGNIIFVYLLLCILMLSLCIIFYALLFSKGVKKYKKIEC